MDAIKYSCSWRVWRAGAITVHVFGVILYAYSLIWQEFGNRQDKDPQLRNVSAGRLFAGRWKYLTHWDHVSVIH